MKTPPPLSQTCDALEAVLSSASPLALMQARPHLVDLVRGIRNLAERVAALEAGDVLDPL
jgi:hypothetical protein